MQLCLFPLVAIVSLLNTSSSSLFNVSTSWYHKHPAALTGKDWFLISLNTKVDPGDALRCHYKRGWRWSSDQGKCLNVSLHTHQHHPVQVDTKVHREQRFSVITLSQHHFDVQHRQLETTQVSFCLPLTTFCT